MEYEIIIRGIEEGNQQCKIMYDNFVQSVQTILAHFAVDENGHVAHQVYGTMWFVADSANGLARFGDYNKPRFEDRLTEYAKRVYFNAPNEAAKQDFQAFIHNPLCDRGFHHPWGWSILAQRERTPFFTAKIAANNILLRRERSAVFFCAMSHLITYDASRNEVVYALENEELFADINKDKLEMLSNAVDFVWEIGTTLTAKAFTVGEPRSVGTFEPELLTTLRIVIQAESELSEFVRWFDELEQDDVALITVMKDVLSVLENYKQILQHCERVWFFE